MALLEGKLPWEPSAKVASTAEQIRACPIKASEPSTYRAFRREAGQHAVLHKVLCHDAVQIEYILRVILYFDAV